MTRKRAPKLDFQQYFDLLGAKKVEGIKHMAQTKDGLWVSVAAGKAGKVSIGVSGDGENDRFHHRTFGINQHAEIKEWALSENHELAKEAATRDVRNAAWDLLAALKRLLADAEEHFDGTACEMARAAIAKAEGKKP